MKAIALIPTYNEQEHIGELIKKAKQYVQEVLVVDNMSTDKTFDIATKSGAWVSYNDVMGAGASTKKGFDILSKLLWCDAVVTLDGDGQHNPDEIPKLLKPIEQGYADIVIGSRFINGNCIPEYRKLGIGIINHAYNLGYKIKLTDTQCGFRAYSNDFIKAIGIKEVGFGFSTEVLVKARKCDFNIVEVPVSCVYSNLDNDSTLNPIKHGLDVLMKTVKWRIKLLN